MNEEAFAKFNDAKSRLNRAAALYLQAEPEAAAKVDEALREMDEALATLRAAMGEA